MSADVLMGCDSRGRMSAGVLMGCDSRGRMSADALMGCDGRGRMSAGMLMGHNNPAIAPPIALRYAALPTFGLSNKTL